MHMIVEMNFGFLFTQNRAGLFRSGFKWLRRSLCLFICSLVMTSGSFLHAREWPKHEVVANEMDFALRDALAAKDYDTFSEYLSLGADPTEWLDNSQRGWVMCAATEVGLERFLKLLIDRGYDVNFRQVDISTEISLPLTCAVRYRNLEALKLLVNAGADPAVIPCEVCVKRAPMSVMSEAILVSKYELAVWLLDHGNYSDEQLATDIRMLETHRVDETTAGNVNRLILAEKLRERGFEVTPWTKVDASKK